MRRNALNLERAGAADGDPEIVRESWLRPHRRLIQSYWLSRVHRWLSPRIGRLPFAQHEPVPLTVPRWYLRTRPPDPAPIISIITPSLNHGRFLEQAIRSVLSQGYPRLEYVVQDGGSTDESSQILERYGDMLTHWDSGPDEGLANAINLGARQTTGEIMGILLSSDFLLPGALNYVARFFASHPEVGLVHGNRFHIDEQDRKVGVFVTPPHDDEALRWNVTVALEAMFWRRSAWEEAGGEMDERYSVIDYELLLRLMAADVKMVHVGRFLGAFRVHEGQISSQSFVDSELSDLHLQHFGRASTEAERRAAVEPYFRRHTMRHNLHRLGQRLPLPRYEVDYLARREPLTPAVPTVAAGA